MKRTSLSSSILTGPNPRPLETKPILIIPRLAWACSSQNKGLTNTDLPSGGKDVYYFQTDTVLTYEHFFADYGPLNLGQTVRFCRLITTLMSDPNLSNKTIVYVCSSHNHRRSNSIYLICAYCVIVKGMSYKEAYQPFFGLTPPPAPFRDAAFSVCPYPLAVTSAIRGVAKAIELGHFDYETFNVDEYDDMDKLENGDCTWIVKGKLMAFSGPQTKRKEISPGVYTKSIEEFPALFKKYGVTGVIRFNKKLYDRQVLIRNGINHYDLYYEDGGNPTEEIAQKFLKICEGEKGGVAVHCKAGLGRTGTNIGNYMIKHYGYTTDEMIAWCRICRPGSVVGPQQQFCADYEHKLLREGEAFRKRAKAALQGSSNGGGGRMRVDVTPEKPGLGMSGSPEKDALRNLSKMGSNSRQVSTSPIKNRIRARLRTGGGGDGRGLGGGTSSGTMPAVRGSVHTSKSSRSVAGGSMSHARPKSSGGAGAGRSSKAGGGTGGRIYKR
ncbi:hypothetical protein TrVE_jg10519 [Triparma verrucosa]|uniref:protein-tyrosine-phosphatase n=1 Tax=Triparma verrucosa TaxID=1606542 RepID=A0A9W7KX79_9STRA|nr:hypothetical protein TrVE_jg10519 [Triparma verrucosa]